MDKTIRRLTAEDYDEMIRVWSVSGLPFKPNGRESRAMVAAEIAREQCAFFGTFDGDKMVALVIANYDGRRGWINRLAVDPDYRHLGLAAELLEKGEEFLHRYGDVIICALIEEMNLPSMGLFKKNGFVCLKEITYWSKRPRPDF